MDSEGRYVAYRQPASSAHWARHKCYDRILPQEHESRPQGIEEMSLRMTRGLAYPQAHSRRHYEIRIQSIFEGEWLHNK